MTQAQHDPSLEYQRRQLWIDVLLFCLKERSIRDSSEIADLVLKKFELNFTKIVADVNPKIVIKPTP